MKDLHYVQTVLCAIPVTIGDIVQAGDMMRIGEMFETVTKCKYDKQGSICCVGSTVDEVNRWWRSTIYVYRDSQYFRS